MKCPRCGHWNKPSFPRCFQCGEPLRPEDAARPSWQERFPDTPKKTESRVVYYDDDAAAQEDITAAEALPQAEESLAAEMTRLKERRARGSVYLEEFRRNAAEQGIAPSGSGVFIRRVGGFFEQVPDDPEETLYEPPEMQLRAKTAKAVAKPRAEEEDFVPLTSPEPSGAAMDAEDLPLPYDAPLPIPPLARSGLRKRRRYGAVAAAIWAVRALTVIASAFVIWQAVLMIQSAMGPPSASEALSNVTVRPIDIDGMPGRRISIAGEEGTQYYISELTKSFVVIGGVAEFEVPDYFYYESIEHLEAAQMDVTLTPTMIKGATEMRLAPIAYTIDIPLSPVTLRSPETDYIEVATSVYNLRLEVLPGSKVTVNGRDISDAVTKDGIVSDNPPIKAIGKNYVTVTVRAPYCRENNLTLVFYREPQEIPLELAADTDTLTRLDRFEINATTMVGASITVETPYESLDVSRVDREAEPATGEFRLIALMEHVGYNTIRIRASYPGKKDSVLEHVLYYLPSADNYTKKAWTFTPTDYKELMNNLPQRIRDAQIYRCIGVITEIVADSPQLAIMDTGTETKPQLVMLQNESSNYPEPWKVGQTYRVYADVSGLYNEIPRLTVRFTYDP
ncbi:MAG: zinc ribbon domain-containing protein [Firmicutes bacterium]|nr:zinc ribbon domain-containing protein [Bacillota bacterium]